MKQLLNFSIFLCLWSFINCSHEPTNFVIGEKQARLMIMSSAQSIQQLDKLVERNQQEKIASMHIIQSYQPVVDNAMNCYDQARDQKIPTIPYDAIASRWEHCQFDDLSSLEKLSYLDIHLTESKIALLQNMSELERWKYFHENVADVTIKNPSQLIQSLQSQLADQKQTLQDSVHSARSQHIAQFYLNLSQYPKNIVDQQQRVLEQLDREEDLLLHDRHQYQAINEELKDLWYGDEQAARTDRWAMLTKKLCKRADEHAFFDKHKILLRAINKEIILSGQLKIAAEKQIRKENKKKKIAEEKIAQQLLQKATIQQEMAVIEVPQVHVEEQSIVAVVEQVELSEQANVEPIEKVSSYKKKRNKKKVNILQQQAQEQLDGLLELQNGAADIDQVMQQIQDQADAASRSQVADPTRHDIKEARFSDAAYQDFVVSVQNNTIDSSENHVGAIQTMLHYYADIACDENVTDENVVKMKSILKTLFGLNQHVLEANQRMSWYVALDLELCKKMNDRFKILCDTYESSESNFESLKSSLITNCRLIEMEIAELDRSFARYRDKEIKSDADKALGKNILLTRVNRKKEFERLRSEYNKIELYQGMRLAQGSVGILNIDRLLSTEDSSTWKDGNFTENFMTQKMKDLESKLNKVQTMAKNKKFSELQCISHFRANIENWCKDIFNHIGLLPKDRNLVSHEIAKNIGNLAHEYKLGYVDEDNLEYSLHEEFVDHCKSVGSHYTPLQINDVVNIQITLIAYLASVLSK